MAFQTVGIWLNDGKPGVKAVARRLRVALEERGMRVLPDCAHLEGCDLIIVLGGDGTFLRAFEAAMPRDIPMLGVNLGRVGFLTEMQPDRLEQDVELIARGAYTFETRMLLEVRTASGQKAFALNEVAFNRSDSFVGILSLSIAMDGGMVDRFSGDGLIVATPTGSTAYSMAAGGPIVAPGLDCMLLTPICPHTLAARPIVISDRQVVSVSILGDARRARVIVDGRYVITPDDGAVTVRRAERNIRFVRLRPHSFFELLRGKLSDWTP
jgi:NAD+ kinase